MHTQQLIKINEGDDYGQRSTTKEIKEIDPKAELKIDPTLSDEARRARDVAQNNKVQATLNRNDGSVFAMPDGALVAQRGVVKVTTKGNPVREVAIIAKNDVLHHELSVTTDGLVRQTDWEKNTNKLMNTVGYDCDLAQKIIAEVFEALKDSNMSHAEANGLEGHMLTAPNAREKTKRCPAK